MDVASRMGLLSGPVSFAGTSGSAAGKSAARTATGQTDRGTAGTKPGFDPATTPPTPAGKGRGGLIAVVAALLAARRGRLLFLPKARVGSGGARRRPSRPKRPAWSRRDWTRRRPRRTPRSRRRKRKSRRKRPGWPKPRVSPRSSGSRTKPSGPLHRKLWSSRINSIGFSLRWTPPGGPATRFKLAGLVCVESILFKDGVRLIGTDNQACRIEALEVAGREEVILVRGCKSGSIEKLTILGSGLFVDGITLDDSKISVTDCVVMDCKGSGIVMRGEGSSLTLTGNHCRGNGRQGMYFVKRSTGVVEGNECSNNGQSGFSVADLGTDPLLRKMKAARTRSTASSSATAPAGGPKTTFASATAPAESSSPTRAPRRPCGATVAWGINSISIGFANGAAGLAENNVAESNVGSGFAIFDNGTNPTLRGNDSRQNKLHGVDCERRIGRRD